MERALSKVAKDFTDGMISAEVAMRHYGAVLLRDGLIDEAAIQTLR